jgi:hypothetical protein
MNDELLRIIELFDEDEVTTADKIDRPQRALDRDAFDDFNKRNPLAGGGMLVQPGFGGTRQGYRSDKAIKAAQQAGNVAKQKARFDKIGKAFIQQDYNALKTLTRPARIAAGAKDAGGILNQADTLLLNNVIFGNDVKAQNALAKQLGINRKYMIDTYKEALKFTKAGKSKKQSELRLKRLETQKNLFDEILENPNATVKSMAKKFNKTEKEIVKQSSLLLKNVYDQNVLIGKKELRDRPLKSWLPDDFNITDNFLDNFSNIKGLKKVQSENIGTLIRDAFGKGQNPKKYTQALTALSEYNKLVNSLPKGLKLNLDHPLSKAFLKGSNVPADQLLFVTPISSDYNRGFKAKLDTAYKNALLNPNKDKKLIKTIENFADTIGVNIGKGSTKKFDFGTANIAKKTKADFAAELTQNLREQRLARENLLKFQKTKEGKDIIKQIFPKGQKIQIPATNIKGLSAFMKNLGIKCQLSSGINCMDPRAYEKSLNELSTKAQAGDQAAAAKMTNFAKSVRGAGSVIKGVLGPAALVFEAGIAVPLGLFEYSQGKPATEIVNSLTYGLFGKSRDDRLRELDPTYGQAENLQNIGERLTSLERLQEGTKGQRIRSKPKFQKADEEFKTVGKSFIEADDPKKALAENLEKSQDLREKLIDEDIKRKEDRKTKFDLSNPFMAAGGGIAKEAGDSSGPPPESGPMSQGLQGLMKRVRNL